MLFKATFTVLTGIALGLLFRQGLPPLSVSVWGRGGPSAPGAPYAAEDAEVAATSRLVSL
jgi:hypothetical protein